MSDSPLNPYAPPQAPVVPPETAPGEAELATTGRRFANYLIDTLVVGTVISFALALFVPDDEPLLVFTTNVGADLAYFISLEHLTGCTIGKLVTGTRVVAEAGGRPSFLRVVGRTFARYIPFEPFSFLGGKDGRPVGWHDSLTKTRVVRVRGI